MADLPPNLTPDQVEIVEELMDAHEYPSLTETQQEALEARILDGGNHLLVAPTSNGKTFCAECMTKQTLDAGGRVAYLVPSQQLVSAKTEELQMWADDSYIAPHFHKNAYKQADVIVATFDSFFQAMLRDIGGVTGLDRVILDDFHVMYGAFRGVDLEKSIAAILDEHISIFAISATIGNPHEIAQWMNAQPIISDQDRGNPIHEHPIEDTEGTTRGNQIKQLLDEESNKAPFLVFNNSRRRARGRAEDVAEARILSDYSKDSHDYLNDLESYSDSSLQITRQLRELTQMVSNGVAYHHRGLPRQVRSWLEELYQDREIGALFCTPTLAYGFDAPVQSVVVAGLKRYDGTGMSYIGTYEYVQWIGRAARPGHGFEEGHAYTYYKNFDEAADRFFGNKELEAVTSHVTDGPPLRWLLLELVDLGWNTPDEIEAFLKQTLLWLQIDEDRAWDEGSRDREQYLTQTLRTEMDWLIQQGFIRESSTDARFETTEFGSAAVEFNFDTRQSASPDTVYDLSQRLEHLDSFTPFTLTKMFAEFTDAYHGETDDGITREFELQLDEHDVSLDSEEGRVAGLLAWYWTQAVHVDEIEEQTGMNPTGIGRTAEQIASAISASGHLFDVIDAEEPDWLNDLSESLNYGVPRYMLPIAKDVEGVGRGKIAALSRLFDRLVTGDNRYELKSNHLPARLAEAHAEVTETQFKDVIKQTNGVGNTLSERLESFASAYTPPEEEPEPLFGDNAVEFEAPDEPSFARDTTLDEFS